MEPANEARSCAGTAGTGSECAGRGGTRTGEVSAGLTTTARASAEVSDNDGGNVGKVGTSVRQPCTSTLAHRVDSSAEGLATGLTASTGTELTLGARSPLPARVANVGKVTGAALVGAVGRAGALKLKLAKVAGQGAGRDDKTLGADTSPVI